MMKRIAAALGLLAMLIASFAIMLMADDKKTEAPTPTTPAKAAMAAYITPEMAKFVEVVPGVSQATLWGDPTKERHGCYTKMAPGFDAGMHIHTNDSWIVVIKGAYLYKDEAGEKHVGPGEFIFIPGGHKHWSGGDATEGALFYDECDGLFDLIPVK